MTQWVDYVDGLVERGWSAPQISADLHGRGWPATHAEAIAASRTSMPARRRRREMEARRLSSMFSADRAVVLRQREDTLVRRVVLGGMLIGGIAVLLILGSRGVEPDLRPHGLPFLVLGAIGLLVSLWLHPVAHRLIRDYDLAEAALGRRLLRLIYAVVGVALWWIGAAWCVVAS